MKLLASTIGQARVSPHPDAPTTAVAPPPQPIPSTFEARQRTQRSGLFRWCISMVGAFWLGSSFGSMKKTEATAARDGA